MAGKLVQLDHGLFAIGSDIAALLEEGAGGVIVYKEEVKPPEKTEEEDVLFVAVTAKWVGEVLQAIAGAPGGVLALVEALNLGVMAIFRKPQRPPHNPHDPI